MGNIKRIEFEEQSDTIKERVVEYWTKRADSFYELRHEEIESNKAERWSREIQKYIPANKKLRILDIGCGSGFFEIILGRLGHSVIGIDLTEEMVVGANRMISSYGMDISEVYAVNMDAEKLEFDDDSFDMIVTRNVTWTLPHPIEAYQEWKRVLKSGGVLLNFDAEYAKNAHKNLYSPENKAHIGVSDEMKEECHKLYHMLAISALKRPQWDVEVLKTLGYDNIEVDVDYGDRIYIEKDRFYMPDKMFSIKAEA